MSLLVAVVGASLGGCVDPSPGVGSEASELSSASAWTLTVDADETNITVASPGLATNTCTAFSTCAYGFVSGLTLTIKTGAKNIPDCEQFSSWNGACAGQGTTCTVVINSDLTTGPNYTFIRGCQPQ